MCKMSLIMKDKTIPSSKESEVSTLGSILIDDTIFSDIKIILNFDDFYYQQHKIIYSAMVSIYERGEVIDIVTVGREISGNGQSNLIGGLGYLHGLVADVPTSLHAKYYANIVKNLSTIRKGISAGHELEVIGYDVNDARKYVVEFEKRVLELQKDVALPKLISPKDLASRGIERYSELKNGSRRGINTGYRKLDEALGGLFGGELCYIGARPGVGKTEMILSIAQFAGSNFSNILLASLEQPWGDILDRLVSRELGVQPRKIRAGNYSDELFGNINLSMGKIAESNMYFYDSGGNIDGKGRNVGSIYSVANHMKTAYGLSAIFIDYLGLLNSDESWNRSRYEKISEISFKLKALAIDLDVPVICACQLNRQTEARVDDRIPRISELRDSGNIEADADTILFLYREDYYEDLKEEAYKKGEDIKGKAQIIIGKHRQYGEVVGTGVNIKWDSNKRCYIDG